MYPEHPLGDERDITPTSLILNILWLAFGGAWETRFTLEGSVRWLEGAGPWGWAAGIGLRLRAAKGRRGTRHQGAGDQRGTDPAPPRRAFAFRELHHSP